MDFMPVGQFIFSNFLLIYTSLSWPASPFGLEISGFSDLSSAVITFLDSPHPIFSKKIIYLNERIYDNAY